MEICQINHVPSHSDGMPYGESLYDTANYIISETIKANALKLGMSLDNVRKT